MDASRSTHRRTVARWLVALALGAWVAGCSLNPQPEPPGATADNGRVGTGGAAGEAVGPKADGGSLPMTSDASEGTGGSGGGVSGSGGSTGTGGGAADAAVDAPADTGAIDAPADAPADAPEGEASADGG